MHDLDEVFEHKDNNKGVYRMQNSGGVFAYYSNPLSAFLSNKNKKLVLFGAGWQGEKVFKWLQQVGVEVNFFCDNNESSWGTSFCGCHVMSLVELVKNKNDIKILIASGSFPAIFMQLDSLGIDDIFDWCLLAQRTDKSE